MYTDKYYGTLKTEVERIWNYGNVVIFDVDVKGGVNLKRYSESRLYLYSLHHLPLRSWNKD